MIACGGLRLLTGPPRLEDEMEAAQEHYEHLLAEHYTWMFGKPFRQMVAEQATLIKDAGVRAPGRCVDLGSGWLPSNSSR